MTMINNAANTFAAVGNREQLADIISNISPTDTPYLSGAGKENAKGTYEEWLQDSLDAPSSSNRQLEGDEISTFDAVTARVRIGNYAQISRKTISVTDTQEVVEKAGLSSELGYQVAKRGKELKRDIEKMLLENIAASAGTTTTARATAGLVAFVKTNVDFQAAGANPSYTSVPNDTRDDSTITRAFSEDILKAVAQDVWSQGGEANTLMVGPYNKTVVSSFAGIAALTQNQSGAKAAVVIGTVDVYVSDFGTFQVKANRWQRERDAWLLDMSLCKVMWLRPYRIVNLAKTGDGEKRAIIAEYVHKVVNEKGLGLAADLSTSA